MSPTGTTKSSRSSTRAAEGDYDVAAGVDDVAETVDDVAAGVDDVAEAVDDVAAGVDEVAQEDFDVAEEGDVCRPPRRFVPMRSSARSSKYGRRAENRCAKDGS
jgi:hypothetical protein